ncbi:NFACT family protein [Thiohalorhabdus sp.]|uniref:NFACT family protein n=1 Tax=Thiohalorhabdus sp. TaxID=3094134 RepID=UPI002FC3094B
MDVIQLHAAAESLQPRFRDQRLQGVAGPDAAPELRFGPPPFLRLSMTGQFRGLFPMRESPGEADGAFPAYLHQRLAGLALEAIEHPWPDRILRLVFARKRLTGKYDRRTVVAEFLGKRCNAALLTSDGRIDRPLYRPDLTDPDARFLPGMIYQPPAVPPGETETAWNLLDGPPPPDLDLGGTGREVAGRIRPVPPRLATSLEGLYPAGRRQLLANAAAALNAPSPQWYLHEAGDKRFLYPFVLPDWEGVTPAGTLEEAWPAYLESVIHQAYEERRRQRLTSRLRSLRKRLEDRRAKVAADEERHAQPEEYRRLGQALTTLGGGVARDQEVTATDYLADPPQTIHVPVQPGRSYQEEAERYFHKARKAERGQEMAARRRYETEADLAELARLEADLAEADADTLDAIADRLDRLEAVPAEERHATRKRTPEGPGAPREYTYRGYTSLVGTNRASNDWLTFRRARPWDVWLHLQGLPGAHVLIPLDRKDPLPPEEVLAYAARLAVTHSPKADRKAEVDWTQVKYVRRHPDGKPGQAIYSHYKTLMAEALAETTDTAEGGKQ